MLTAVTWDRGPLPENPSVVGRLEERCESLAEPTPCVIVLVFAFPDSHTAHQLLQRREYFNARSGKEWDIFFPGYYQYGSMRDPRETQLEDYWGFSPRAFDGFRRDLEAKAQGGWRFSGESELVALNAFLGPGGPVVDFASIVSGPLTEPDLQKTTRTLAQAIERLGQQFEDGAEDEDYGLREVLAVDAPKGKSDSLVARIGVGAAGGVAAAVIRHVLGLP